jgi:hypothetical protein
VTCYNRIKTFVLGTEWRYIRRDSMRIFLNFNPKKVRGKKRIKILRKGAQQLVSVVSKEEKDVLKKIILHILYTQFINFPVLKRMHTKKN